jgi:prepilin-type processing-associated H-X9-DG protein
MRLAADRTETRRHDTFITRGFTVVELLSLMGAGAILGSLITPKAVGARPRAQKIQCGNNLRQVGITLSQFVADTGEYPLGINKEFSKGKYPAHSTSWRGALELMISSGPPTATWNPNGGIWDCPTASKPADLPENIGYSDFGYNWTGLGVASDQRALGLGGHFSGLGSDAPYAPPVRQSEVAVPSEMMALGDGLTGWNGVVQDGLVALSRRPIAQEQAGSTERSNRRHAGTANVSFCDRHVDSPTLNYLFVEISDRALRRWNRDNLAHAERMKP